MSVEIKIGDSRAVIAEMPDESIDCCVSSPPYFGLRSYLPDGHPDKSKEVGAEPTPDEFVTALVDLYRGIRRVLKKDGTVWLNLGDSYTPVNRGEKARPRRDTMKGMQTSNVASDLPTKKSTIQAIAKAGLKQKDLIGVPWRVAFALQADGWYLRSAIVWAKPNGMPGSQQDRCTSSYEMVFLLSKSKRYWSDFDAIKTPPRESTMVRTAQDVQAQAGSHRANGGGKTNGPMKAVGGRTDKQRGHVRVHAGFNERWDAMERSEQQARPAMMRDVWFVSPAQYYEAHFAVMPDEIARRCILAGCPEGGTVLDPFGGAGTTGLVAQQHGRSAILIELNPEYAAMARARIDAPPKPVKVKRQRKVPANDNAVAPQQQVDLFTAVAK